MKPRVAVVGLSLIGLLVLAHFMIVLFPGIALPFIAIGVKRVEAQQAPKFYEVATSPDGKLTAERSTQRQFRVREGDQVLWQRDDLKISDTQTAVFSPDNRQVVTFGWQTQLWEARTGVLKATLHSSDFPTIAGAIAPDGRTLAAGSWDSILRFWNIETWEALGEWKGVGGAVKQVQWLEDGKSLLLTLYSNRSDKLRSKAVTNALVSSGGFSRQTYPGGQELWKAMPHEDEVSQVVFAPGGKQMLSSGRDGQVFLWQVDTGVNRLVDISIPRPFGGHIEFSPDGQLALIVWGREARLYRLPSLELADALDLPGWKQVRFSPDAKAVVDSQTQQQVPLAEVFALKGQPLTVSASESAQAEPEFPLPANSKPYLHRQLQGWLSIVMSPGREFFASLPVNPGDPYVYLWDAGLTRITRRFRHPLTSIETLDIAADGKTIWMKGMVSNDDRQLSQRVASLNLETREAKLLAGFPRPTRFTPQATATVAPDYSRLTYMVAERRPEAADKVKQRQPLTAQDYSFELRMVDMQSGALLWKWPDAPLHDTIALALGPLQEGENACAVLRMKPPAGENEAPQFGLTLYHIKTDPLPANLPHMAPPEGPKKVWQFNEVQWPQNASGLVLSFSPDGRWLATSGGMREAGNGQLRYALPAAEVALWLAGSQKIALSDGTHAQRLDVPSGKVESNVPAVGRLISVSDNGDHLATSNSTTALLWKASAQPVLPK